MPVPRTRTGARPLRELERRLEDVEIELEDLAAERESLTRWCLLLARSLDGLEDRAERQAAATHTCQRDPLFALQAWVRHDRVPELREFAERHGLLLQVTPPSLEEKENPPTLLDNPPRLRAGEDLVNFYQTPGYWVRDPSSIVFFSFAIFFGMIVADFGYAAVLGAMVLALWRRMGSDEGGRRWRILLAALSGATATYGVLVGSYFGVTPPPDSLLGHLQVLDLNDATSMMALSIVIGAAHIVLANLLDARRHGSSPMRWVPIGWAAMVSGGTAAWGGTQTGSDALTTAGAIVGVGGLLLAMWFAGWGQKSLKRVFSAFGIIAGLSGLFGDVMSYLRLFALGLASASLAAAFNDMAGQIREAVPGIGFLLALLILLIGHTMNFVLSLASGFIHGLRLNVIEFFKYGVKEEGPLFRAFQKKERN
jgi:V/A-type H+-transporting ATPase subunit I